MRSLFYFPSLDRSVLCSFLFTLGHCHVVEQLLESTNLAQTTSPPRLTNSNVCVGVVVVIIVVDDDDVVIVFVSL